METLETLVQAVDRMIDTACLDKDDIINMLNRQQLLVAGGGERIYGMPPLSPLPGLEDVFQVRAFPGRNYTDLPSRYHRGDGDLAWFETNGEQIDVVDQIKSFYKKNSKELGEPGTISRCCFSGGKLHYVNSPTVETDLVFPGYRYPKSMVVDQDVPDGIPAHLQYPLFVNGSVYVYYNFLDQDQNKPLHNIGKHQMFFQQALTDLQLWIQAQDGAWNMEADLGHFQ
jgi:hypothetical protein